MAGKTHLKLYWLQIGKTSLKTPSVSNCNHSLPSENIRIMNYVILSWNVVCKTVGKSWMGAVYVVVEVAFLFCFRCLFVFHLSRHINLFVLSWCIVFAMSFGGLFHCDSVNSAWIFTSYNIGHQSGCLWKAFVISKDDSFCKSSYNVSNTTHCIWQNLMLICYYVLCLVEKPTRFFYCCTYGEYLNNEALEGSGDFKVGKVIRTVKYRDGFVILAKE